MIYLILAILSSACVSLVMRISVKHVKNNIAMLGESYLFCTLISFIYTFCGDNSLNMTDFPLTFGLGLTAGILLLAGFIFYQYNVRVNGVVLTGIFAKLGVLVPTVMSIAVFKERPAITQILGFILALSAIFLINFDKNSARIKSKAALIMVLLADGMANGMSKVYEEFGTKEMEDYYILISFAAAFILCMIIAMFKGQKIILKDMAYGFLLGLPNYYSVRFLIKALAYIPAVIVYPTYSVATIALITTMGVVIFKEKLSSRQKLGICIILGAIVLLNI